MFFPQKKAQLWRPTIQKIKLLYSTFQKNDRQLPQSHHEVQTLDIHQPALVLEGLHLEGSLSGSHPLLCTLRRNLTDLQTGTVRWETEVRMIFKMIQRMVIAKRTYECLLIPTFSSLKLSFLTTVPTKKFFEMETDFASVSLRELAGASVDSQ